MTTSKILEGVIDRWVDRGPSCGGSGGFGFIEFDTGGASLHRIFYLWEGIDPDNIGRRSHGRIPGAPVRFRTVKCLHRGQPSTKAIEVQSVFPTDVPDPESHREVSVVERIIPGAVFLARDHGDQAFLTLDGVAPEHQHKFHKLRVGDHVYHGVRPPDDHRLLYVATEAEFYSEAEEFAFASSRS